MADWGYFSPEYVDQSISVYLLKLSIQGLSCSLVVQIVRTPEQKTIQCPVLQFCCANANHVETVNTSCCQMQLSASFLP